MIRIAVQARGRLNEESMELLRESGISIDAGRRMLLSRSSDFPVEVLFLRDDDIPHSVAAGVADMGIVGLNEVREKGCNVDVIHNLGFGRCRLSLAIAKGENYTGLPYFNAKKVATSYPNILREYFEKEGVRADIHEISGSVEIAPSVGMADAIFDIVSSGSTLVSNGLKEVEKVLFSEAVLVATPNLPDEKRRLAEQLMFRFEAVERSRRIKYVLMNLPEERVDEAAALLPGMKSPTILSLAQPGWCSMHVVISESELWTKIEQLKAIGAEDILVLALEKMIR